MTGSRGITLIELLVGMTCFSIVMILVTGIFVTALSAKKQVKELSVLQDEARYIMDYMSREIRTSQIVTGETNELEIVNSNGESVKYEFANNKIERKVGANPGEALNTVNVSGTFVVDKIGQPKVTINMTLTSVKNPALFITISTTISSRSYE